MARVPAQPQHQVVARRHVQRLAARPTRSARRRVDRHPCRLLSQQAAARSHTPLQLPLHRSLCLRLYQRRPKIYQTHRAELRTAVRSPPRLLQHQPHYRTAALAERHLHAHHPFLRHLHRRELLRGHALYLPRRDTRLYKDHTEACLRPCHQDAKHRHRRGRRAH